MDDVPVGNAGVEHRLRSAVDRDGACARLLQKLCQLDGVDASLVPALAHLDRHGNRHRMCYGFNNPRRFLGVSH